MKVVVALAVAGAALLAARASAQQGRTPPIAIVGVDGADWQTIDKLVAAGRLPTFAALKQSGAVGVMRPDPPLLSPIIWTTIATGRRPEDHGVLDFMIDLPGGRQAPVGGGARVTKALWEIFSDARRPVFVAGWWATWPADRVEGLVVSDRVATPHVHLESSDEAGLVYPEAKLHDVEACRLRPDTIPYEALSRFVPLTTQEFDEAAASDRASIAHLYRNRFAHARAALASTRTYRCVARTLLPQTHPAFAAVYFEVVDTVSHLFVADARRRDAAIANAYAEVDEAIADTARALDPDALLLVVSDHGFYGPDAGIADDPADLTVGAAAWHRPYGIVAAIAAGALTGRGAPSRPATLGDVSPLDLAPTILARAGLPVARDMPGHVIAAVAQRADVRTIASYGAHRLPEPPVESRGAAAAELERLRALGYVSGASTTSLARVNLGEILFRKGDARGAIRELEPVLRADPLNDRASLWLARAYIAADRAGEGVRVYDRLIQAARAGAEVDPIVVLAATDADLARGDRGAAAARLAALPARWAGAPETLVARGSVAAASGKIDEAERTLRRASAVAPANLEAISRLVDLLLNSGHAAGAARVAADAARRYPESPERQALAGETALAVGRPAEAALAFRTALRLSPDARSIHVELARAELLRNRPDAALDALGAAGPSRDAEVLRGAAYSKKGDWRAAVEAYNRAAAAATPTVELLNALGNAQLEAGQPDQAVATLERSLAIDAGQPQIRELLERARRMKGRTPR